MADTNYTLALDIAADGAAALQAADAIEKRYASLGAGVGDTIRKALEDAFGAAAQTLDTALQQAAKNFSDAMKGAVPDPPPPPEPAPAPERQEPPAGEQQSAGDDALAKAVQEAAKAVGDSTKAIEAATKSIDEATKAIGEGHSTPPPPPAPPAPPLDDVPPPDHNFGPPMDEDDDIPF